MVGTTSLLPYKGTKNNRENQKNCYKIWIVTKFKVHLRPNRKYMNTMTYKGYLGSVNYSDKDQVFFGKIEGINGLVNFEGESVKELTAAFHEAVDDYLAYCEDEGIEPDKSYTGVLNVRLTPSIHRQIAMLALQAGLSINAYIKEALEEKVEEAVAV